MAYARTRSDRTASQEPEIPHCNVEDEKPSRCQVTAHGRETLLQVGDGLQVEQRIARDQNRVENRSGNSKFRISACTKVTDTPLEQALPRAAFNIDSELSAPTISIPFWARGMVRRLGAAGELENPATGVHGYW